LIQLISGNLQCNDAIFVHYINEGIRVRFSLNVTLINVFIVISSCFSAIYALHYLNKNRTGYFIIACYGHEDDLNMMVIGH
jgi:hypothetical protein